MVHPFFSLNEVEKMSRTSEEAKRQLQPQHDLFGKEATEDLKPAPRRKTLFSS